MAQTKTKKLTYEELLAEKTKLQEQLRYIALEKEVKRLRELLRAQQNQVQEEQQTEKFVTDLAELFTLVRRG